MNAPVPASPTPVLDALERLSDDEGEFVFGDDRSFHAFKADVAAAPIVSIDNDLRLFDGAFGTPLETLKGEYVSASVWIEATTPFLDSRRQPDTAFVRTGVLADLITVPGLEFPVTRLRFVLDLSVLTPVSGSALLSAFYDVPDGVAVGWHLADLVRARHGYPPAHSATTEQLLQMSANVAELDGEFVNVVPDGRPTIGRTIPMLGGPDENGFETLRWNLGAWSFRDDWLKGRSAVWAEIDPKFESVDGDLHRRLLAFAPVIATPLIAIASKALNGTGPSTALAEPFARGREARLVGRINPQRKPEMRGGAPAGAS